MTLSGRDHVAFAVQPVLATPVAPDKVFVIEPGSFRATESFEQILDTGRRGVDAMDFKASQGVGITEIQWDGIVRQGNANEKSSIGYLLDNLLGTGALSTVVQLGATGNYDHRLILGNTKEYLTLEHTALRNSSDRRFPACRVHQITISFNRGEGAVRYSVQLQGKLPTAVTTVEVSTPITDVSGIMHMGWEAVAKLADAANARLLSAEWTLTRAPQPLYSADNSQDFADLFLGPLEVTCSLVLDYSAVNDLTSFRTKDQTELSTIFRAGVEDAASERKFAIGGRIFDLGDGPGEIDSSETTARLNLTARGLYTVTAGVFSSNAGTNAVTAAQNSPVEIQIIQPDSVAY